MSDQDRTDGDDEIDRLQKELLAFVVDQLTTQADSSGIVALPPKLMAAVDAHAAASLAHRVQGVTLPDTEAFTQTLLARVGCEGKGMADRVAALEAKIEALTATGQQQAVLLGGIADHLKLAPPAPGAAGRKPLPIRLIAVLAGIVAVITALLYFGGSLAMEMIKGSDQPAAAATGNPDDTTDTVPDSGESVPKEGEQVTPPVANPALSPASNSSVRNDAPSRPAARPPAQRAPQSTPKAATPSPASATPAAPAADPPPVVTASGG